MTEKQYAPSAKDKKMAKEKVTKVVDAPIAKAPVAEKKETREEVKTETPKAETKKEDKKVQAPKVKREFAFVNATSVPVSTKYAVAICKFIKGKRVGDAIRDLEDVMAKKKHVPMIGEYGHKKGVGKFASGAGKYPLNASKHFIVLLKSLAGNSTVANIDEPIISECVANKGARPMGRFGRWERKRTHVKLVAREMKVKEAKK